MKPVRRAGIAVGALAVALAGCGKGSGGDPDPTLVESRPVSMRIDCRAPGHAISPLIYGIGFQARTEAANDHQWELGTTARRWGGNDSSRYNWELGNAWNAAHDWFFCNYDFASDSPGFTYRNFLENDLARGVGSALTLPMLGWVARDTTSCSFPVDDFGPQELVAPDRPWAGNGVSPTGELLTPGDPSRTSVASTPESIGRWIRELRRADDARGVRSVQLYILDNEPTLWNSTHRDVRTEPLGYDELLERTIAYGREVRSADPEALIAGPAAWGWNGLFYSGIDDAAGHEARPDRLAHGDEPLVPWYLRQLREHEERTGERLLDVLDVHTYPGGEGIGYGADGETDPDTSARRLRATRSLWDPSYRDESWIDDHVRLIPRMREWVEENYPGLRLAIGEYSFGAEGHLSGGLAQAEALGRFGEQDLWAAFYWTYPAASSPAFWAFRAFRDYDGQGARFLDWHVPASAGEGTSLFVSRSETGDRLVAVALNLDPEEAAAATIELDGCGPVQSGRRFLYTGQAAGFEPAPLAVSPEEIAQTLPPYSITVFELQLPARLAPAAGP